MNILLSRSRVKSATNYNEVRFPDNGLRIFFMNISDHYSFLLSWLIIFFLSAVSTPSTAQKAVVYGTITDDTSGAPLTGVSVFFSEKKVLSYKSV